MTTRRWFGLLALSAAPLCLAADGLNVATGLWEISYTTATSGMMMPQAALDKLTPEQRAKMIAAMQSREAAGPKTHTLKSCVTAKDLKEGAFTAEEDKDDANCKNKIVTQTSARQEMTVTCTGEESRNGRIRIEAVDNKHVKGVIDMATASGKVNVQLAGKWVATSCAGADED